MVSRFSPAPSRRTGARWRSARSRTDARRHLGKQELSAVCRPAVGAQIDEIFRTREEPLVAAGAIRRPPEQLWVARSSRRKDDALPVGRPERAAVRGRVGRQPAQRRAGEIVDPDIRPGWRARAARRRATRGRRGRSPAGGQAAVRHVPGDPPTRRSAGHRHRPHLGRRRASRWRPPRRQRRLIWSSPRPRAPAQASLTTSSRPRSNATARNVPATP